MPLAINSFSLSNPNPSRPADSPLDYSWDVSGATTITIKSDYQNHSFQTVNSVGSNGEPINTWDYCNLVAALFTLTAIDGVSTITASDGVDVAPANMVASIVKTPATPSTVTLGQPISLDLEITNVCVSTVSNNLDGVLDIYGPGVGPGSFTALYTPTATSTYTMTADQSGAGSPFSGSVQFWVLDPPTIDFFTANPSIIQQAGDPSTLSWGTTDAVSVSIDQGIGLVPVDGTYSVSPSVDTVYTLLATASNGTSVTALATISIRQMYVTIFDGENTGQYAIDELRPDEGYLKILGQFKKTTAPDDIEKFSIHQILNTLTS
jgi:hypothetical protein